MLHSFELFYNFVYSDVAVFKYLLISVFHLFCYLLLNLNKQSSKQPKDFSHSLKPGLKVAEENMKEVENIKDNIGKFKESLYADENKLISEDSGFSDTGSSGLRHMDKDKLESKRKHLEKMSSYLGNLFRVLPPNSPVAKDIGEALRDASKEMASLSDRYTQAKDKSRQDTK